MNVEELINKLKDFPPNMQVIVPSDDGRKIGFNISMTTVYEVKQVDGCVIFSYKKVGTPLLLIDIQND